MEHARLEWNVVGNLTCTVADCEKTYSCRGWCNMHYKRAMKGQDLAKPPKIVGDDVARFWSKVDKTKDCWTWTGILKPDGYARFRVGPRLQYVHIYSYRLLVGEYDSSLQLDHLCRTRHCVNPAHLEPVTQKVNMERSSHATRKDCRYGHPYAGDNLYVNPAGSRACKECHRQRNLAYRAKLRSLSHVTQH